MLLIDVGTTRLSNLGELQTIDEPLNRPEMQAYLGIVMSIYFNIKS